jgi:S1-C subfamily serine protease
MTDILVEDVAWYDVADELEHPGYSFPSQDLRLLFVEDVLPEPYATLGLEGECTHLVAQGYGHGSNGKLHERVVNETDRDHGFITTDEGVCNGDSGGPLYAVQGDTVTQVGVTSWGTSTPYECTGGTNGFVDLTAPINADWVKDNIR